MQTASERRRTVLLVDDDPIVRSGVSAYLSDRSIEVTPVSALPTARDLLRRQQFDALVLDLNLGSYDGLTLAREVGLSNQLPLLIISARATESDRIIGLELGADDYLIKPFGFAELHTRLRTIWRRMEQRRVPLQTRARFARWLVDLAAHELYDEHGHRTPLTAAETALLRAFLTHPRVPLTRLDLLTLMDRSDADVFERVIDVLLARVRRKLEGGADGPTLIETIRGHGYRLNAHVTWEDAVQSNQAERRGP